MFRPASAWRGVRWGYTLERHGRVHEAPQPVVWREPEADGGLERQRVLRRRLRSEEPPGHRPGEEGGRLHRLHGHVASQAPEHRHQADGPVRGHARQDIPCPHGPPLQAPGIEVQLQAGRALLRRRRDGQGHLREQDEGIPPVQARELPRRDGWIRGTLRRRSCPRPPAGYA